MRFTSTFAVSVGLLIATITGASAAETIVPGSCKASGLGKDWCDCTVQSDIDGSKMGASVQCNLLLCFDYANGGQNPDCRESHATCAISNRYMSGVCQQSVVFDGVTIPTADAACVKVVNCLNTRTCAATYCMGTTVRYGWELEGITPQN